MPIRARIAAAALAALSALSLSPAAANDPTPYLGEPAGPGEGLLPERFAIVIGIDRYETGEALQNLTNASRDAELVAEELKKANFYRFVLTTSSKMRDEPHKEPLITRNDILNRISTAVNYAVKNAEAMGRPPVILFYFAGHGINYNDNDYLVPSDFRPSFAEDIPEMAIPVKEVVSRLSWAGATLQVVFIDACRTQLPITLIARSSGTLEKIKPGNGKPNVAQKPKAQGIDDSIVVYSTWTGDPASDSASPGAQNGPFATALVGALAAVRAESQKAGAFGQRSKSSLVLKRAKATMENRGSKQRPEYTDRASEFRFYPTAADFKLERELWKNVQTTSTAASQADPDFEKKFVRIFYCNYFDFVQNSSYYSYFGAAALKRLNFYRSIQDNIDCENAPEIETLKTTVSEGDGAKLAKALQGIWVNRPPSAPPAGPALQSFRRSFLAPAQPFGKSTLLAAAASDEEGPMRLAQASPEAAPSLDDLRISDIQESRLSDEAKGEVSRFPAEVRLDDLAVSSAQASLFNNAVRDGKPVGSLSAGELVQILEIASPSLKVRTAAGLEAYVDQQPMDSGRIALKFDVQFDPQAQDKQPKYNEGIVDWVLRTSLVADMLIQYPRSDKLIGLANAHEAYRRFGQANVLARRNVRRFVPSFVPADDSLFSPDEPSGKVRVTFTLMPFSRAVRQGFSSLSGAFARPADAINVTSLDASNIASVLRATERATDTCTAAVADARAELGGGAAAAKVSGYVHFRSLNQKVQSERIRQTLRAVGISPPTAQQMSSAPKSDEIRFCSNHDAKVARVVRNLLNVCELGAFNEPRSLPPCRKTAGQDRSRGLALRRRADGSRRICPLRLWRRAGHQCRLF